MAINYAPNYGYGNGFMPANYSGNFNAIGNNQTQQMFGNQQNVQSTGSFMTVLVQGEAGANAYPVASGNTVLLMDFDSNKFWLKSNVNGIPQRLRPFSFKEDVQEQSQQTDQSNSAVTREEFNKLAESVNRLITELGGTNE